MAGRIGGRSVVELPAPGCVRVYPPNCQSTSKGARISPFPVLAHSPRLTSTHPPFSPTHRLASSCSFVRILSTQYSPPIISPDYLLHPSPWSSVSFFDEERRRRGTDLTCVCALCNVQLCHQIESVVLLYPKCDAIRGHGGCTSALWSGFLTTWHESRVVWAVSAGVSMCI